MIEYKDFTDEEKEYFAWTYIQFVLSYATDDDEYYLTKKMCSNYIHEIQSIFKDIGKEDKDIESMNVNHVKS